MSVTVQQFDPKKLSADAIAIFIPSDKKQFADEAKRVQKLWKSTGVIFDAKDFTGAREAIATGYTGNPKAPRIILVGLGPVSEITAEGLRRAAAGAATKGAGVRGGRLSIVLPTIEGMEREWIATHLTEGALLANYRYDKLITLKDRKQKSLKKLSILTDTKESVQSVRNAVHEGEGMAEATLLARDLANAPSNEIYPETLAERAQELSALGVNVTVFGKEEITEIGMGGLLAVNQGSTNPPRFIIMEWNGGEEGEQPIVLVGKGITFDSGGISLKPGAGMGDMKMDMGGSAAVIGAMHGIAKLGVKKNVVALVASTENMPSGSAYKPGDVITFLNGKTAEIDNTDAEGRLVLADALTYADRYKPAAVVDLATLTGACMIALGHYSAAVMGNNEDLNSKIKKAGNHTYERVTELPLWEEYEEQIKSDVADVKNTGGRPAGAITAGLFLQHFIGDYPWAHIDIAGVGINPKPWGYTPRGGTGFGARLMVEFVRGW
ncbi:MAG: leucyl aminopeptidase [Ignavibacteriae bacterium]|nr:leucyl aminopeptidase [Ignavibacteriota bacterium]MCB9215175.1 leucyl aminopeptidase [Ignavibacteria bacterium]